jgi:uncharacterized protein YggE
MKKVLIVTGTLAMLSFICLFTDTLVNAQVRGNAQYDNPQSYQSEAGANPVIEDPSTMTLSISGLLNARADDYVATFNIIQVGETIEKADEMMSNRINKFIRTLKTFQLDTNAIKIDMVSFVPKFDYEVDEKIFSKMFNEVPVGFEVQKNITIHYKNSATLNALMSAAAQEEIYDLVKVEYFLTDINKEYETLRRKCADLFKLRLKSYESLGFKLDTLKKVFADDFATIVPQTRYAQYQAFSRPSLDAAKKKTVLGSLKVKEVQRPQSTYYNAVSYDQYDLVVNPVIDEPVVQLTYKITVKYFLKESPKENNTYFMISPQGEIKPLVLSTR